MSIEIYYKHMGLELTHKKTGAKVQVTSESEQLAMIRVFDVHVEGMMGTVRISRDDWEIRPIEPLVENGFYLTEMNLWRIEDGEIRRLGRGFEVDRRVRSSKMSIYRADAWIKSGEMRKIADLREKEDWG